MLLALDIIVVLGAVANYKFKIYHYFKRTLQAKCNGPEPVDDGPDERELDYVVANDEEVTVNPELRQC